jgi:asparagine synthase (glutamine-hydrolysing)
MFAFAIWNETTKELFLARDRLGVKPLYYAQTQDGSLYFASEIKSLLQVPDLRPALNLSSLPDYLANHAPSGEDTLFVGIKRLSAGHTLSWRDGRIDIEQYWNIDGLNSPDPAIAGHSEQDLIRQWSNLFEQSVELRLMADVPLGAFLSGGIDSSAIVAVMSKLVKSPVKTFSVAFKEREANELNFARLVARKFKTDHHEVLVEPEEFFSILPLLTWHEDEPIAHPSSVALYFVSRLASEHVKVVLTGEGSDELLAGYERYRKALLLLSLGSAYAQYTPKLVRQAAHTAIGALPSSSAFAAKLKRTFLWLDPSLRALYLNNFAVFSSQMQEELLSDEIRRSTDGIDPFIEFQKHYEDAKSPSLLNRLLYVDAKIYLHELLMKQDQMSMAASIESRVPFLDHKLVEFSYRLPENMKLRNGWTTKYVLRQAMSGILPSDILHRSKMGFPVPLGRWFRGGYRHIVNEYLLSQRTIGRGIFNPDAVRSLVARHQQGENHSQRIWSLMSLEIWMRCFLDGERPLSSTQLNNVYTYSTAG